MIDEPGGGTRPELPVVLGGRATSGVGARHVPLRTILGASSRATPVRRLTVGWWATVAWGVAVLAGATSAFAVRDTMFPTLGRTEPPSAWEAPTRPPASIPYVEREGVVPTGTTVAPAPAQAADGTPLLDGPVMVLPVETDDDHSPPVSAGSRSTPTSTVTTVAGVTPPATAHTPNTAPPVSTDVSSPTTTDSVAPSTGDTLPDDGGGKQRGRDPGDTIP